MQIKCPHCRRQFEHKIKRKPLPKRAVGIFRDRGSLVLAILDKEARGFPQARIARETGVSRGTVRDIIQEELGGPSKI